MSSSGNNQVGNRTPVSLVFAIVRGLRRLRAKSSLGVVLTYGNDFTIGPRARLARGRTIRFGRRVNIAADFVCMTHVRSGDDIMISSNVAFIGNDHSFDERGKTIQDQPRLPVPTIVLEGDNLIGFGTIVIGPVSIGKGTIVGAGSLVNCDLPENSICVGRPARLVRARFDQYRKPPTTDQ